MLAWWKWVGNSEIWQAVKYIVHGSKASLRKYEIILIFFKGHKHPVRHPKVVKLREALVCHLLAILCSSSIPAL